METLEASFIRKPRPFRSKDVVLPRFKVDMQEYECYVPKENGDFTKQKKRVYSFHHANLHSDYKRSKPAGGLLANSK